MRNISASTLDLIKLLNEPVSFWERLKGARDNEVELLSKIGNSGEPAAIIEIISFILAEKREVTEATAASIDKLVRITPPAELVRLDWLVRERSPYGDTYSLQWHKLLPTDLDYIESFGEFSGSLLGLASFHQSGYLREEAIKRLDRISSGAELPFLLIRLNDWVRNVRDAARRAINARLTHHYARSFIANLALVIRLKGTGRDNHQQLIEAIKRLIKSPESRDELLEGLKSPDLLIRRSCFNLAMDAADSNLTSILQQAFSDQDTVIRLRAAQEVPSAFESEILNDFLLQMKRDRYMPVRREALRIYVKRFPEQAIVELRSALLDSHASIRDDARYHLQKIAPIDLASFYRQAVEVADEKNLFSAISGLGESGSAFDCALLLPYATHGVAKIRKAAIRALARLNGDSYISVFIDALSDEVPGVSREAQKALSNKTHAIGGEQLCKIFQAAHLPHIKRSVLFLLGHLGKWDSIYFLIEAMHDPDEEIIARSRLYIQRWLKQFNRGFSLPTHEQLARIRAAVNECGGLLDVSTREQLSFSLKGF